MLEVKNIVTPSPEYWVIVTKGMRNAFKSQDKLDSVIVDHHVSYEGYYYTVNGKRFTYGDDDKANYYGKLFLESPTKNQNKTLAFCLGEKDKKLLLNLTALGTSDRKVLRQLPIIMEVRAPLTWWKQADKYQVGTVTSAESTMHTLTSKPITVDDFSLEYADEIKEPEGCGSFLNLFQGIYLKDLNYLREMYLETRDDRYKQLLFSLLPESYMQTRTWSMNYEVALQIIHQRTGHPLKEWHQLIDYMLENVPYLKEIYEASCGKGDK